MAKFWDHFVARMFATFTEMSPALQPVGAGIVEYAYKLGLLSVNNLSNVPLALLVAIVTPGGPLDSAARREFSRRSPHIMPSLARESATPFPVRMTEAARAALKPGMGYDVMYRFARSLYRRPMMGFVKALRMQGLQPADHGPDGRFPYWLHSAMCSAPPDLRPDLVVRLYFYNLLDESVHGRVATDCPVTLPPAFSLCGPLERKFLKCSFAALRFRTPVLWSFYGRLNAVQVASILAYLRKAAYGPEYEPDLDVLFPEVVQYLDNAWKGTLECMAGSS